MAELNPVAFLLNQGKDAEKDQVVDAPAFSLTKVLTTGAGVIAPLVTVLLEWLKNGGLGLSTQQYVVLLVALLGFLAITAAADILGRSLATAAEKNAQAAGAAAGHFVPFSAPLAAQRITGTADVSVDILAAAQGDQSYLLVKEGEAISWLPASTVKIGKRS